MNVRVRIQRWVVWWFYLGVFCGGIALANILGRSLTIAQERILLIIGALHWLLGGLVCWAFEGVKVRQGTPQPKPTPAPVSREAEWHPASDFLLPGSHHSLLSQTSALSRHSRRYPPDSPPASGERPWR